MINIDYILFEQEGPIRLHQFEALLKAGVVQIDPVEIRTISCDDPAPYYLERAKAAGKKCIAIWRECGIGMALQIYALDLVPRGGLEDTKELRKILDNYTALNGESWT
jgi:hypothetical protein